MHKPWRFVSQRSFGLKIETLEKIYISIIRSVLEYSSLLTCNLANSNFKYLLKIQSKAIKNHKTLFTSSNEIKTSIISLKERFDQLNINYLINAINNKKKLINTLWSEYNSYKTNHLDYKEIILCKYRNEVQETLSNNNSLFPNS